MIIKNRCILGAIWLPLIFGLFTLLYYWAGYEQTEISSNFSFLYFGRGLLREQYSKATAGYRDYQGPLPYSVWKALKPSTANGYLLGDSSELAFHENPHEVDLRIIVIVFNRPKSLQKCLDSLNNVLYGNSTVSLHVWLDRSVDTNKPHEDTLLVAKSFKFNQGRYQVHIQTKHAGIQHQWTNTWRPKPGTKEVCVILEDDLSVSRYFWLWLRQGHAAYYIRNDIAGFGLHRAGIAHGSGMHLSVPISSRIYLYKVICTWGFSPHAASWRAFQDQYYANEQSKSFEPLVPGILPSQWWASEKKKQRERNLWEMWHIHFTHNQSPPQYTVMLNTFTEGCLAVNRHEEGLHDKGGGRPEKLLEKWDASFANFKSDAPKINYMGRFETLHIGS